MMLNAKEVGAVYEKYLCAVAETVRASHRTGRGGIVRTNRIVPIINGVAGLRERTEQSQYELDVAMWCGALSKRISWKEGLIRRIFAILCNGGLLYKKKDGSWHKWADSNIPIAAALSHGGRIMIQIPKSNDEGFWDWLWGDHRKETRLAATHGVLFQSRGVPLVDDKKPPNLIPFVKLLNEMKGNHNVHHFGVNIGLGGVGNFNPWSGNKIREDGRFGHLYIGYRKPTRDRVGAMLVGCEGSAPFDRYKDIRFAKGQGGGWHFFGGSGEFSPTGGYKWKKTSWHPDNGPCSGVGEANHYDAMFVDLTAQGWRFLENMVFSRDQLGQAGPQPTPHPNPNEFDDTIPTLTNWKLYSEKKGSRRSSQLIAIDEEVKSYNELIANGEDHQKDVCLQVIIELCDGYKPSKQRRQDSKVELKRRAEAIRATLTPGDEVPGYEHWLSWSRVSGPGGRRPGALRKIDDKIREYEAMWVARSTATVSQKRVCLTEMALLCGLYDPQKIRRKVAKRELKRRATIQAERP